jgi:hypothetical protein
MRRTFGTACTLATVLACFLASTAPASAGPKTVNFNAIFQGGFGAVDLQPPFFRVTIDGEGQDPTLGHFTLHEVYIFNSQTGLFAGNSVFTFDNGDQLFGATHGSFRGAFSATTLVNNGTGSLRRAFGLIFVAGIPNTEGVLLTNPHGFLSTPNR